MKELWNERFSKKEYLYGQDPNGFFADQLPHLPKGNLLLPAEGEGRNAVFAASLGWEVTAFDYSEAGMKKALKLAEKQKVKIDYQLTDAAGFKPQNTFDCVALIYAHFHMKDRAGLFAKLENALAPGGYLIAEVYSQNQLGRSSGGPKDTDLLYTTMDFEHFFPNLRFMYLKEEEIVLNEGALHQGKAMVVRVVARKP